MVLGAVAIAAMIWGLDDRSTPIIVQALTAIGTVTTALVAALKASQSADRADKAVTKIDGVSSQVMRHTAQTNAIASKTSAIQEAIAGNPTHLCHDPLCSNGGC